MTVSETAAALGQYQTFNLNAGEQAGRHVAARQLPFGDVGS